jgi:hypothetical protein
MEEDPASLTEKRRTLRAVRWLILFIAVATALAWLLKPPATETRTLFLHPDGQLSLGSRDGEKFSPSTIAAWGLRDSATLSVPFILDTLPETPLSKWTPTIEHLATEGQFRYQLRAGGKSMNFHLPGGSPWDQSDRPEPQWIDLRRPTGDKPPLGQKFDVVVLADNSTTCDEVLTAAHPHQIPGTSLVVNSESLGLLRSKSEEKEHESSSKSSKPPQGLADRIRTFFQR